MEKKNLQPQQQKPVVRPTLAKPTIEQLKEEQLTASCGGGAIAPADYPSWMKGGYGGVFPF